MLARIWGPPLARRRHWFGSCWFSSLGLAAVLLGVAGTILAQAPANPLRQAAAPGAALPAPATAPSAPAPRPSPPSATVTLPDAASEPIIIGPPRAATPPPQMPLPGPPQSGAPIVVGPGTSLPGTLPGVPGKPPAAPTGRGPVTAPTPASPAPQSQSEKLFAEAVAFAAQEKWREAIVQGRRALNTQRQLAGKNTPDECTMLENIGIWQELFGDFPGALATWRELLPLSAEIRGREHWVTVGIHAAAASCEKASKMSTADQLRLAEAARANGRSERLFAEAKYGPSRDAAVEALETRAVLLGRDDAVTSASMHNAGAAYLMLGDLPVARRLLEESLTIRQKAYGDKSPATLTTLQNLTLVYMSPADAKLKRDVLERILTATSAINGPTHHATVVALYQLGNFDLELDKLAEAEPVLNLVLVLLGKLHGPKHIEIAHAKGRLGLLLYKKQDLGQANKTLREAVDLFVELAGEQHVETARALLNLATLEMTTSQFAAAEQHFRKARATLRKQLGETHPETIEAMHGLARVLTYTSQHAEAERLYREVIATYEGLSEFQHQLAVATLELGILYNSWNDIGSAERYLKKSLESFRGVFGDPHPATANAMLSLAAVDIRLGRLETAEQTCQQALRMLEETLGADHSGCDVGALLLAGILCREKKYAEAERQLQTLLARRPDGTAEERYQTALIQEKLALVSFKQGKYAEALARALPVIPQFKKTLPADHPHFADIKLMCGVSHLALGQLPEATIMAEQALAVARKWLDSTSLTQSEQQQISLALLLREILDLQLSVSDGTVSTEATYEHVLRWKGAIQARQIRNRQAPDAATAGLLHELQQVSSQLAALNLRVPESPGRAAWMEQLDKLRARKVTIESDLAFHSAEFRSAKESAAVTPQKLRECLPAGTALVDILQYVEFSGGPNKETPDETRYLAFIVRPDRPVVRVDLGSAEKINTAIEKWRQESLYVAEGENQELGQALRKLLWQPLAPHLANCPTVLISPDSEVARLPVGALPGEKVGTYLIEELAIGIVPVPQMIPELLGSSPSRAGRLPPTAPTMLIVGDIDYDAAPGGAEPRKDQFTKDSVGGELLSFGRLKSAPAEILALRSHFSNRYAGGKLSILDQGRATEAAFRQAAPQNAWLLVATHGFFAPQNLTAALAVQDEMAGLRPGYGPEQSGALAGLALAGANRPAAPGSDDGILTAYEVAALDLRKVELAVLSGCETGLGKNAFGEGVMSMQRAFQVAGAKTTVASLWNVPDRTTSLLMQRFYANLWDQPMSKLEALREAQLWILHSEDVATPGPDARPAKARPPYYWAAFMLSGDWR